MTISITVFAEPHRLHFAMSLRVRIKKINLVTLLLTKLIFKTWSKLVLGMESRKYLKIESDNIGEEGIFLGTLLRNDKEDRILLSQGRRSAGVWKEDIGEYLGKDVEVEGKLEGGTMALEDRVTRFKIDPYEIREI